MTKAQVSESFKLVIAIAFALSLGIILTSMTGIIKTQTHMPPMAKLVDGARSARSTPGLKICLHSVEFSRNELIYIQPMLEQAVIDGAEFEGCENFLTVTEEYVQSDVDGTTDMNIVCLYKNQLFKCTFECTPTCR